MLGRSSHPPPTAAELKRQKAERQRAYIASLSDRDWDRIHALAREVTRGFTPARLDDLDARGIAVGVCAPGGERYLSGERIGTIKTDLGEVPVLVWVK